MWDIYIRNLYITLHALLSFSLTPYTPYNPNSLKTLLLHYTINLYTMSSDTALWRDEEEMGCISTGESQINRPRPSLSYLHHPPSPPPLPASPPPPPAPSGAPFRSVSKAPTRMRWGLLVKCSSARRQTRSNI